MAQSTRRQAAACASFRPAEEAEVDVFVRDHLGATITDVLFSHASVGRTHGLQLDDGQRVVLKVRRAGRASGGTPTGRDAIQQVVEVQRYLHERGYPAPEPLFGPHPCGGGLATVERYLDRGRVRSGQDPAVRTALAAELFEQTRLLRPFLDQTTLSHFAVPRNHLFPEPYDAAFRPLRSGVEIDWVFRIARRARAIATRTLSRPVVAHQDLRVEHVRFERGEIVATFDWDSVAVGPEVRLVGANAHGFSGDWSQSRIRRVPTYDTILGFIDDYEAARGYAFSSHEHRAVRAWAVYWIAYGAWLLIERGQTEWPEDSWPALLQHSGEALLR
ncbi:MAG: hypothetical protein AAF436_21965 [Myxococcota bacterium]